MNDIILTCCGAAVTAPPRELDCPATCGAHFAERQIDGIQMQEIAFEPVVDVLRAARMLNQPPDWIIKHAQLLSPIRGGLGLSYVFPLTAIRRFATERSLPITPLPTDGALWLSRNGRSAQS